MRRSSLRRTVTMSRPSAMRLNRSEFFFRDLYTHRDHHARTPRQCQRSIWIVHEGLSLPSYIRHL
jgi:hypothetical protein